MNMVSLEQRIIFKTKVTYRLINNIGSMQFKIANRDRYTEDFFGEMF